MTVQLYTSTKPADRRRAWVSAASLLAITLTLALMLTRQRAGGIQIPRMEPEGWTISFQPPPGFGGGQGTLTQAGPAYQFGSIRDDQTAVILMVTRATLDPTDEPLTVCERVFRSYLRFDSDWHSDLAMRDFTRTLGPFEAVELWDPRPNISNILVRCATLTDGEAYAVSLACEADIKPDVYRLFDETCASVTLQAK